MDNPGKSFDEVSPGLNVALEVENPEPLSDLGLMQNGGIRAKMPDLQRTHGRK